MKTQKSILDNRIPSDEIPVLLTIFNRPDKTKAVIENLRKIKPKRLYIAADGPRPDRPEEVDRCRQARETATSIDWSCEIKTRFLENNIGVDPAVSSAIDWFFQNVEYGIILEDDCIVHPHFFDFCGELLVRYSDDERMMQISSLSPYDSRQYPYDYHFSQVFRPSGGWSTWRRAWKHYTSDVNCYGNEEAMAILKVYNSNYHMCRWKYNRLIAYKNGSLKKQFWSFWDVQWIMACSAQNGLNIVPEKNLMINIGFDEESTHTKKTNPIFENLQLQPLQFPLRHPPFVYSDYRPERTLEKRIYNSLPVKSRVMYILRQFKGALFYLRDMMPY